MLVEDRISGGSNAYPIKTERAPSGVTRMAGAKAYAAKLNISPRTTRTSQLKDSEYSKRVFYALVTMPAHQVGFWRYEKPSPSNPCFSAEEFRPCMRKASVVVLPQKHV